MARINAPQLNRLCITFFNQIVFDTRQFIRFVNRTPTFKAVERGHLTFGDDGARVKLSSVSSLTPLLGRLSVKIPCRELDRQVSSLEQVFTSSLRPLSTLEDLYIHKVLYSRLHWHDDIDNALWLDLLRPFFAVKESLHVQDICATYRACPTGARWGQDDRSVAHPAEYILGGTPGIGTCPGGHSAVRFRATGNQSPCSRFYLGELGAGQDSRILTIISALCPIVFCHLLTTHYFPLHSLFLGIIVTWSPLSDCMSRRIRLEWRCRSHRSEIK